MGKNRRPIVEIRLMDVRSHCLEALDQSLVKWPNRLWRQSAVQCEPTLQNADLMCDTRLEPQYQTREGRVGRDVDRREEGVHVLGHTTVDRRLEDALESHR